MKLTLLFLTTLLPLSLTAKDWRVSSPNKQLTVTVTAEKALSWQINHGETAVLAPSEIALNLGNDGVLGANAKVKNATTKTFSETIRPVVYKKATVENNYTQLMLNCSGGYKVEFRVYDDAAAYRFITEKKGKIKVTDETAEFNFPADYKAFIPYINDNRGGYKYSYSFESYYDEKPLSQMYADSLAITPLLVDIDGGKKAAIMEADLDDYAGMFLVKGDKPNSLKAAFAPLPLEGDWGGWMEMNYIPSKCADYIAETDGKRAFPWRAVIVSTDDSQLLSCDLSVRLGKKSQLADTSWIKPGKVAWDWWNTTNITGVDFKAGMNTDTYKHFIDFAAENHLEYIIIDCGWSGSRNDWKGSTLMHCIPEINLEEVINHGNKKGVGVILWASWALCDKEHATAFPHYAKMGVKGFKVDFLDADDQKMIQSMKKIVQTAADNHLLIDLHGMKPTGLQYAYPNIVNFEGVKGLENCKWAGMDGDKSSEDFLRYDVTIPFIRTLCGPMDYTPGAMTNAQRNMFRPINDHPMSQGTRVHQMAMYTLYDAPLQMLSDSPTAYRKNQKCTDFIAAVPTVFDETITMDSKVGEYVALARRKGSDWWVGAMTNWDARSIEIPLSFLPEGKEFTIEIFQDGINADTEATDYKRVVKKVNSATVLKADLAPGGGWTARIK
ncbi:MAG: glycoside hydrolase family 97 protein [Bacteroidaceae bacterium]|nr:glycoside hydrolase family 97 protein [Bacteroidaceae bacterium]